MALGKTSKVILILPRYFVATYCDLKSLFRRRERYKESIVLSLFGLD